MISNAISMASWGEWDSCCKGMYVDGCCRFFVVEDTILHTTQELRPHKGEGEGLVTLHIVHEFWQMALSEVLAVLRNNCVRGSIIMCYIIIIHYSILCPTRTPAATTTCC